jgi:hypothetical protein
MLKNLKLKKKIFLGMFTTKICASYIMLKKDYRVNIFPLQHFFYNHCFLFISSLNSSVAEPEPHLLVGAGAVTQCGSGGSDSDSSSSDNSIKHGWELKIDTKCNSS